MVVSQSPMKYCNAFTPDGILLGVKCDVRLFDSSVCSGTGCGKFWFEYCVFVFFEGWAAVAG